MRFIALVLLLLHSSCAQRPFQLYRTQIGIGEEFGVGNGLSTGLPNDGIFYAVTRSGNVYTLNESTGLRLNTYVRPDIQVDCQTNLVWDRRDYQVGVYSERNNVILIDSSGSFITEFQVAGDITGQPSVSMGNVYVPHNDGQGKMTIYSIENQLIVAQLSSRDTVGPVETNPDSFAYYGSSLGTIRRLNQVDFNVQAVTDTPDQSTVSAPYADDTQLLIQGEAGVLYWWQNDFEDSPLYTIDLSDGFMSLGQSVAPQYSQSMNQFYVISGSTLYAFDATDGSIVWRHRSGVTKTKPVLDGGAHVYNVESTDGRIYRFDAGTGDISPGYPYVCEDGATGAVCNQVDASANALLTDDGTAIWVVFDDGTLIATCVECAAQTGAPSSSPSLGDIITPTTTPTSFESPAPSLSGPPTSNAGARRHVTFAACILLLGPLWWL